MVDIAHRPAERPPHVKLAPSAMFSSPRCVLEQTGLSHKQKIDILHRWAYEAAERAVALEEGMPDGEEDLQRQILLALAELHGRVDVEHCGPTKHHGLPD